VFGEKGRDFLEGRVREVGGRRGRRRGSGEWKEGKEMERDNGRSRVEGKRESV
jgi:hypothetical protein